MAYSNITLTCSTNLSFRANDFVQITHDELNYIVGRVVSYNPATGVMELTPTQGVGNGTFSEWTISLTGESGTNGTSSTNGTSGTSGANFTSGSAGTSGTTGTNGTSATNGVSSTSGLSETSGTDGSSGTSGTSGTSASSGASGSNGSSGTSGTSGSSATSGTSGTSASSGSNGNAGASGSSGSSGTSGGTGPTGPQGPQGGQGPLGARGTSGSSGVNGGTGPTGPTGPTGGQGPAGAVQTGPQGPTGPTGPANSNNQTLNQGSPMTFNICYWNQLYYATAVQAYDGQGARSNSGIQFLTYPSVWQSPNGAIGSPNFFPTSTQELKYDIKPFTKSALDILNATKIVSYEFDIDSMEGETKYGFIAEETPEEIAGTTHDRIIISSSIGVLIKALQELDKKLKEKEALYS
jgi:hypothetical protein